MGTTSKARIYGASDDLIEFDGAIYGEAGWYSDSPAKITLKAPDGTKMRLAAQFCGGNNVDGWAVTVKDNPYCGQECSDDAAQAQHETWAVAA